MAGQNVEKTEKNSTNFLERVIQVAGVQRIIESDPRELYASGNFANVPRMFGANAQEGALVFGVIYNTFLLPNNLTENEEFLANEAVPSILDALHISDPNGELAAQYTEYFLADAVMGNLTSMTPGLVDMCGTLFLKAPTYDLIQLTSQYNPDSYFYSFEFSGRNSLFNFLFARNPPPVSHGADHGDELIYLFIYPFPSIPPGLNQTETILSKKMLQTWTNFVTYSNPTPDNITLLEGIPKFLLYSNSDENYMKIGTTWEVKKDFTTTYTITADELKPAARKYPFQMRSRFNYLSNKQ